MHKQLSITLLLLISTLLPIFAQESADSLDRWALVSVAVANVREKPAHAAELGSQAVMGTPIKLTGESGDWWSVTTPEGYNGYIIKSSLAPKTADEMQDWRKSLRAIVSTLESTHIYIAPDETSPRDRISDLVNGCILEINGDNTKAGWLPVTIPDGRKGYVRSADMTDLRYWASKPWNAEQLLDYAYSIEGTTYLWGGTSNKGLDCSGLSKTAYYTQGIILKRNSSQQARCGQRIDPANWRELEAGDLLFFGNPETDRVTHVAIYDRDGWYIHSSGRVKRNSINPESDGYLSTPFLWATRMRDSIGTEGITRAADHPWYFEIKDYE